MEHETEYILHWKKIMDKMKYYMDEWLKNYDITFSQFNIIMYLKSHCNEVITQKRLENYFELSHVTIIGILKRLESKGFLICAVNPDDRRSRIVMLKQKSIDLINSITPPQQDIDQRLISVIGEDKFDTLKTILREIYQNFDKIFVADYLINGEE